MSNLQHSFLLYAVFTSLGLIFIIKLVPETKGVTLDTIEANLYSGKKLRNLGK